MSRQDAINFLCAQDGVDYVVILERGRLVHIYKDGENISRGISSVGFSAQAGGLYETTITRTYRPRSRWIDGKE